MRLLATIAVALLAGGTTHQALCGPCTVYEMSSGSARQMGLVQLPHKLDAELRAQLPAPDRSKYICWYVSGESLIAGDRRNLDLSNLGYVFVKRGNSWVLTSSRPIILALPRAVQ